MRYSHKLSRYLIDCIPGIQNLNDPGEKLPDYSQTALQCHAHQFCPLCDLLHITLNELLSGELISDENLKEKSNQLLLEVITSLLGKDQWENKTNSLVPTVLKIKNLRAAIKLPIFF